MIKVLKINDNSIGGQKMKPASPSIPKAANKEKVYKNVLNPIAQQKSAWDIIPLIERPATLEEKTVYIINQRWGGTKAHEPLLLAIKQWLEDNIAGIHVVYKAKLGSYAFNDIALWQEVGEKADAAIIGVPH
jgi:hypothetical protein